MHRLYVRKQLFALFLLQNASIDLVTVLEAILTRRKRVRNYSVCVRI